MLNPASDSVLTRQLVSDLQSLYTYSPDPVPGDLLHFGGHFTANSGGDLIPESQPTVVELQSDNDTATDNVFPIGTTRRNVSGVGRLSTEADYDQRSRRSVRHMAQRQRRVSHPCPHSARKSA
jgi:hypothetical protein